MIAALAMSGAANAQCDPAAPPYTQDFNAVTTPALPTCMSIETISGNPWTTVVAPAGYTGNIARVTYTAGGSPDMNSWLYTKGVVLTGGTSYRLTYTYGNNSTTYSESMSVAYGTANSAATMTNPLADHPSIGDNAVHTNMVDFIPSTTGTYYVGFKCYSIADQYNLYLDDISLTITPTCFPPTGITASNVSTAGADLTWTDNTSGSYNYEVRTSGAPGSGATGLAFSGTVASGTPAINVAPLVTLTTYTLYVQGSCSGGTDPSVWSAGVDFTPGMIQVGSGLATNTTFPIYSCDGYTYSQEIYLASELAGSGQYITKIAFKYVNDGITTTNWNNWTVFMGNTSQTEFSTATSWIASTALQPVFSGTVTPVAGTWMQINLNTPFLWDGTSNVVVAVDENAAGYSCTATWQSYAATGDNRGIAFYADATNPDPASPPTASTRNSNLAQIQFFAGELPDCIPATSLTVSNVASASADLSWTASSSDPANGYQWEVRSSGEAGSGATGLADSGTTPAGVVTATTTVLDPNTAYTLYVRSDCGSGFSPWSSSSSFTTLCAPEVAPYIENFDAALATPDCWTNTATGGTLWLLSASLGTGPNYGVAGSVDHTTGTGNFVWFDGSYNTSIPTLTSPLIDITPLTQAMVSVWVKSNNVDDAALNTLKVQAYNGTAWVDLITHAANNPAWLNLTAPVPPTIPSPAQFRLTIISSTAGSAFYNDILVDDFEVYEAPTCLVPTDLDVSNVTLTSADLTWTASLSEPTNGYQWEVRTSGAGGSGPTGLIDSGVTGAGITTASSSILTANTTYTLYVRTDCGAGDFSFWASSSSFFTGYCVPAGNNTSYYIDGFSTTGGYQNITNTGTGYSGTGYGDFTAQSVSQSDGGTVNFNAVFGSSGNTFHFRIWVDWNNDFIFDDANELMFDGTDYQTSYTGSFSVPAGTAFGDYRMRIRDTYTGTPGPCGTSNGEAEDYTFTVGAPPSCQTPTNLAASNLTLTTGDLSWTASPSTPSNGYQWEVRTSGVGGSGASGLTDSGTTGAGVVTASTSLLVANTNYTLYVRGDCGAGDFSTWASSPSFFTGYCTPEGNNVSYYINDFSTTDGFQNITNTGTGYSDTGYGDFTGQVVSQADGGTVTFNTVFGSGGNTFHFRIWVDWNNDYAFDDATELMFDGTVYQTDYTGSFTVPTGTAQGDYRMRIRNTYTGTPLSCGISNGETEDYILEVIDPALIDCEGVYNGPAMPGTACTASNGFPGVWSDACTCVVVDCEGVDNGPALPGTPCYDTPNGWGGIWNFSCACIENVGVDEIAGSTGFSVYPNPASSILYITTPNDRPVHVKVYDMVGTLVIDKDMVQQLDITKLATGSYTLVATDAKGGNEQHARFMKQ